MDKELTTQEQAVVDRFAHFISREVEVGLLIKHLDNVLWQFVIYVMEDANFCGNQHATDDVYWLKVFRDMLKDEE